MRLIPISAAVLAMLAAAAPAEAQSVAGHRGGGHHRWGGMVNGRWHGGVHAPGGWGGYVAPVRGFVLPSYWVAPQFVIRDWPRYRFSAPPRGHTWVRYYDDAVLVDDHGRVSDAVRDVDWNRYDGPVADGGAPYDGDYYDRYAASDRRDSNVEGAVAGAVVGGVAGNLIAGRGNRLGGTLIGAGLGALAGAAIDAAEDGRRDDRGPGAPYDTPGHGGPGPHHGGPHHAGPADGEWRYGGEVFGPIGAKRTRIVQEGYVADGWYYPPVIETQMVVGVESERPHPAVMVEERTYRSDAPPKTFKRVYRTKGK
ncbi:RcnB family protein [Sphingomonas sp. FW199]|uniref:RcnB family protein n=1 Tax=Sphingomonas sp. FW199 TaxID=3400217 RepID=UPI003CEB87AF